MLLLADFQPAFYTYFPLICLAFSLPSAIGISAPRHKGHWGRLFAAIVSSAAAGTALGFAAAYATGKWSMSRPSGGNDVDGVLILLVTGAVSILATYVVAKWFPSANRIVK